MIYQRPCIASVVDLAHASPPLLMHISTWQIQTNSSKCLNQLDITFWGIRKQPLIELNLAQIAWLRHAWCFEVLALTAASRYWSGFRPTTGKDSLGAVISFAKAREATANAPIAMPFQPQTICSELWDSWDNEQITRNALFQVFWAFRAGCICQKQHMRSKSHISFSVKLSQKALAKKFRLPSMEVGIEMQLQSRGHIVGRKQYSMTMVQGWFWNGKRRENR